MLKTAKLVLLALATIAPLQPVLAVDHTNKKVMDLVMDDYRDCAIFRLDGVSQADPVNTGPGAEWIAVPRSHPKFAEIYAMLLTAKAGDLPVGVQTTGVASACAGFVGLKILWIP